MRWRMFRASMLAIGTIGLAACGDDEQDQDTQLDGAVGDDGAIVGSIDGAVVSPDGSLIEPRDGSTSPDSATQGKLCSADADCVDTDSCTSNERCNTVSRCEYDLFDGDGDGYPPTSCGGTDCDDARGRVNPGASESCNGRDDDCDGMVDDDVVLPAGEACRDGEVACASGYRRCGTTCRDIENDPNHCGGCNDRCDSGQTCALGECSACAVGGAVMMCGGQDDCADTSKSELNCGSCGNRCSSGQNADIEACIAGDCVSCGGENQPCCETTTTLLLNCLPGFSCEGTPGTAGSKCVCGEGSTKCGANNCVDLKTDELNCGECGNFCRLDETCTPAGCQPCGGLGERCCTPLDVEVCDPGRVCGPDDTCVIANTGGPG